MTTTTDESIGSMTLRYTQQLGEILHACRVYQRTTRKHQIYRIVGLLTIFLGAWLTLTTGVQALNILVLLLGVFAYLDPMPLLMTWVTFRTSIAQREAYETTIDDEGTHFRIGTSRTSRPWSAYRRAVESDQVFLLIYGNWLYSVLPKRAIGDPRTIDQFRAALRTKIDVRPV
jgi:hypothetical protein